MMRKNWKLLEFRFVGNPRKWTVSLWKSLLSGIEFANDRYEVKLPFKENVSLVSDNYETSQNRWNTLKKKLSQNGDNLTEYNTIM